MRQIVPEDTAETKPFEHVGLSESARRFVRRFYEVDEDNIDRTPDGDKIELKTWEPKERTSHIDCMREKVQTIQVDQGRTLVFTFIEVEYKCGVREEMFRWRRVDAFEGNDAPYDQRRGMLFL